MTTIFPCRKNLGGGRRGAKEAMTGTERYARNEKEEETESKLTEVCKSYRLNDLLYTVHS